jgi:hypothetical protein
MAGEGGLVRQGLLHCNWLPLCTSAPGMVPTSAGVTLFDLGASLGGWLR